jgi:hypothetical protein
MIALAKDYTEGKVVAEASSKYKGLKDEKNKRLTVLNIPTSAPSARTAKVRAKAAAKEASVDEPPGPSAGRIARVASSSKGRNCEGATHEKEQPAPRAKGRGKKRKNISRASAYAQRR